MSMFGVFITSVCTPVGFSHLFTLLGTVIVQPEVLVHTIYILLYYSYMLMSNKN